MLARRVAGGRRAGRTRWPLRGSGRPAVTSAVRARIIGQQVQQMREARPAQAGPRVRLALQVKAVLDCIDPVG